MNESLPRVSMSPTARYVTQSSIFSTQLGKPLTDRRIAQLQRQGYYSGGIIRRTERAKQKKKRVNQDKLFARFLK